VSRLNFPTDFDESGAKSFIESRAKDRNSQGSKAYEAQSRHAIKVLRGIPTRRSVRLRESDILARSRMFLEAYASMVCYEETRYDPASGLYPTLDDATWTDAIDGDGNITITGEQPTGYELEDGAEDGWVYTGKGDGLVWNKQGPVFPWYNATTHSPSDGIPDFTPGSVISGTSTDYEALWDDIELVLDIAQAIDWSTFTAWTQRKLRRWDEFPWVEAHEGADYTGEIETDLGAVGYPLSWTHDGSLQAATTTTNQAKQNDSFVGIIEEFFGMTYVHAFQTRARFIGPYCIVKLIFGVNSSAMNASEFYRLESYSLVTESFSTSLDSPVVIAIPSEDDLFTEDDGGGDDAPPEDVVGMVVNRLYPFNSWKTVDYYLSRGMAVPGF